MISIIRWCLCSLLFFSLVACDVNTGKLFDENEVLQLKIYGGGWPVKEFELRPGTEKYEKLRWWSKNSSDGWLPTPATYVPGVIVYGKGFSINFLKEYVIINLEDGQFYKSVSLNEYEYLKN